MYTSKSKPIWPLITKHIRISSSIVCTITTLQHYIFATMPYAKKTVCAHCSASCTYPSAPTTGKSGITKLAASSLTEAEVATTSQVIMLQ